ncbi:uncharacterized protein Dana_GF14467 [Drosophila ananassae]|uniref:Interference hedgehog n=1 Tax=Drosophila ananassae TaxID=7217 RepID=IHOG_DROAN|nr:interference hedgehog [Drosophila ananassae]B3MKS0.1 RecName: Full=Interference hedgehog; Flags: Precursor [Drosophila ananassae]EDV31601.1 uncharacterized protein Dana_GF14467 [Drosophila ananassae]
MPSIVSSLLLVVLLTSPLGAIPVLYPSPPPLPAYPSPGVRILRPPESLVAPLGDEVVLECETSLPPERFEWSYRRWTPNGTAVNGSPGAGFKYLKTSSMKANVTQEAAISRLKVLVRQDTLGEYRCNGWFGPLLVTSTTARLELATTSVKSQEPVTSLQWQITNGNSVLWPCGQPVRSNPAASWTFYRNGVELGPEYSGTGGNLFLRNVSVDSSGSYSCQATNPASGERIKSTSSMELQVVPSRGSQVKAPYLLPGQPGSQTVTAIEGGTLLLLCPGVGSPPPTAVWSSPDIVGAVNNKRTRVLAHALEISNVQIGDSGTYICYLDNGVRPPLEHFIQVKVEQPPQIVRPPWIDMVNEGERVQLECEATGVPTPEIYWLLNGKSSIYDTEAEQLPNGHLVLHSVLKRHAGYVQCFARNSLGEHSAGMSLQVTPKPIHSESTQQSDHNHSKANRGRRPAQMIPPSAPNVTRLSDESVMLRWMVPRNDGLAILFFKVQYRTVGEGKRKNWQTTNENIPYGRPEWNSEMGKSFTASVTDLKPQRTYRFRIMAVYTNNDNKESNMSAKFFLQPGAALDPMPVPEMLEIDEYSETAVVLHWRLDSDADEQLITGYYAYYRPSSSAGEYFKATIEGASSRSFTIGNLEAGTVYEFKLQSFSAESASEFSALKQGRTQRPMVSTTEEATLQTGVRDTTTPSHNETFSMSPIVTGTIGGGAVLILFVVTTCLCMWRRRNSRAHRGGGQNKPRMAELREDFVPLDSCSPTKQRQRSRHIHITLNPLAQQQQQALDEKNDAEHDMTYFQRQPTYDYDPGLRRMSSSSLRRSQRTLERAGSSNGNNNNLNQSADMGPVDNPGKPGRVLMKRPRLSSRSENLSSGSLNSVGV